MSTTPPCIEKRGSLPSVVAIAISGLVFTAIPLAQWVSGEFNRSDTRQADPTSLPPPPELVIEESPKEESKAFEKEIPPMKMDDIAVIFGPVTFEWGGIDFSGMLNPEGILPKIEDILTSDMMDAPPSPTVRVKPNYTGGMRGRVDVMVVVGTDGRVIDASVRTRVDPEMDRAALLAASRWRFEPGTFKGKPAKFRMIIPFVFTGK